MRSECGRSRAVQCRRRLICRPPRSPSFALRAANTPPPDPAARSCARLPVPAEAAAGKQAHRSIASHGGASAGSPRRRNRRRDRVPTTSSGPSLPPCSVAHSSRRLPCRVAGHDSRSRPHRDGSRRPQAALRSSMPIPTPSLIVTAAMIFLVVLIDSARHRLLARLSLRRIRPEPTL